MKYIFILVFSYTYVLGQDSTKIGNQIWAIYDLHTTYFLNGDSIPYAQSNEEWEIAGMNHKPAWCKYQENEDDETPLGILYNIYAITDPRGIVPEGWRISTIADWKDLEKYVLNSGSQLIDLLTYEGWQYGNREEKYDFSIFSGGWRDVGFGGMNENITYWCEPAEESQSDNLMVNTVTVQQYEDGSVQFNIGKTSWIMGHYVRLVKDGQ